VNLKPETLLILGGLGLAVIAGAYLVNKASAALDGATPGSIGVATGAGIVNAGTGAVIGLGDGLGIPRTDTDLCAQAKADGRTWDASKYCTAGDFLAYMVTPAPVIDQSNPQLPQHGVTGSW
jgi:hypothetical protein